MGCSALNGVLAVLWMDGAAWFKGMMVAAVVRWQRPKCVWCIEQCTRHQRLMGCNPRTYGQLMENDKLLLVADEGVGWFVLQPAIVSQYNTVQYRNCGRGSQTSALASEPRAHEGARRPVTYLNPSGQGISWPN